MTTFAHIMTARIILFILSALILHAVPTRACTSALVGRNRSASGKMLLWKHRDTFSVQNFIARGRGPVFDFVALFNAGDSTLSEAWAGVNRAGFAVMNTASYNLAPDTAALRDREGLIMTLALGSCATIGDFENMLDTLPRPLGVQANFGAMDRTGHGAYYETDDNGYRKFPLTADSLLIRTNFSCSGQCGPGLGLERYDAATTLIGRRCDITPILLTDTVSCSFHPHSGRNSYIDRGQYIPRYSTSASIVIDEDGHIWIKPGYPPLSPVTYRADIDSIPSSLLPDRLDGWHSPAWRTIEKTRNSHFRQTGDGTRIVTFIKPQL